MTSPAITSTVPGAVKTLAGYMQAVALANPELNPGVYVGGIPTTNVRNNFLMIGNWETGAIITPETYEWAAIPGMFKLRSEAYALQGTIRTWGGSADITAATARIDEAFTLLNGLHQQIVNDLGGSGNLSPSGSWGAFSVEMPLNGQLGGTGWGVYLAFELHVINVQLSG